MAKKKNLNLENFVSNSGMFVSIFKGVPIGHLETVRNVVKQAASEVSAIDNTRLEVRMRFRGPRYFSARDTLKSDAKAFDVYVNTKAFPRKASSKQKEAIKNLNRESVREFTLNLTGSSVGMW